MDEKVLLKVEGMDCANCASTITRTLKKEGLNDVTVDFITGEVTFQNPDEPSISKAITSINRLGYKVMSKPGPAEETEHVHVSDNTFRKFIFCLCFTVPLFMNMFLNVELLHQPYVQLLLCLPVMIVGILHFGRSAFYSVRSGVPNMDVLIITGSSAAFIYSVIGMMTHQGTETVHHYMFFETSATIITLVLLGNLIEQRSVKQTTSAITKLSRLQPEFANRIDRIENNDVMNRVSVSELKVGDSIQVNNGDRIPLDGKIISGNAVVNESMITGESRPVVKSTNDDATGGTVIEEGSVRIRVEHTGKDTVLSKIIELVRKAQHLKPEIQKLGDRISAIFVPVVLGISVLTFIVSFFFLKIGVAESLMRSIAVLVISCPCAMGLATPTAVMVGLGRAAQNGILIKGGSTIELLSGIRTIVFDKTGTITTGNFKIRNIVAINSDEKELKNILLSLEKNSSHPIARSLIHELKDADGNIQWKSISEDKGIGVNGTDVNGNLYSAGSFQMVKHFYDDLSHDVYVLKNNKLIGTVDIEDEIKPGVKDIVTSLKEKKIRVILLSGDKQSNSERVAGIIGIEEVYSGKLPAEKLEILSKLTSENPVAMVGDGINDAPALSQATVGISLSSASDIAIESAQVILLNHDDLSVLLRALHISDLTYRTIRQNLFWAFFYNIIAIPIAASGFLSPMIGALSMAFSDVIVIGNSLRLRIRKL